MKKIAQKIFAVFLLLSFFPAVSNAQQMRLDWKDMRSNVVSNSGYTVYIGIQSRKYDKKFHCGGKTLAINIQKLPLQVNSPNFISAKIDGDHVYSSEIVILWTGDLQDSDNDGLSDSFEQQVTGTLPDKKDTDEDGIPDGEEYATWGKNWELDFDEDGKVNLLDNDSDGDGIPDGEDPGIRRIPYLFHSNKTLTASDNYAFVHLYHKTNVASDLRSGKCQVTLKWDPVRSSRAMRYRLYSREEGKPYNYNLWEVETLDTTTVVEKLEADTVYYFTVRAVVPSGLESSDSAEIDYEAPKKACE